MQRQRGRTTSVAKYIAEGWREDRCATCNGTGLAYARRGGERGPITGMEYCDACGGRGSTWRSPSGLRCSYPGGPWIR